MTRTCRTESHDKKVVGPSCRASGSLVRPGGSMPGELHRHHGCISRVNYFHPMPHPIHDKELTGRCRKAWQGRGSGWREL